MQGSDDGCNVLVGATQRHPLLFHSYGEHPKVFNHALDSTAAGRYQIIHRTWLGLAAKLGLTDFGPESRDRGAIKLIRERGALENVETGRIGKAIHDCCEEWASFPGNDYGQHAHEISALGATYRTLGGAETDET